MYSLECKLIRVGWISHLWLLKDTHFLWLERLTMLVNNTINIFLKMLNVTLYYVPFIKYLWRSKISLVSIGLKSTNKNLTLSLIVKSFEMLPKNSN